MNYYEQFYDDLEFEEEEDPYHHGEHSRDPREQPRGPRHGYHDDWSHRDEMYREEDYSRGHHPRDSDKDFERRDWEDREPNEGQGYRGRGRGQWHRGRGFGERGRGFGERGRGFGDRGRGKFARGGQRGRARGVPMMNFVKASEPPAAETKTEPSSEKMPDVEGAVDIQPMPVLSAYGYGPGSGFEEFGVTVPPGAAQSQICGPGVPGEEVPTVSLPHDPSSTQSTASVTTSPSQPAPSKVVTAVVKPMFNFVKARNEFKSTDVAFHEAGASGKLQNPALFPSNQVKKHAGLGMMAAPKAQLQTYDVGTAFNARAKDGCNPLFDAKFNRLREAVKMCSLPLKNSIEVIHMATDKVKMKIADINRPGGRTPSGQVMFSCRLEIDGVFVAEGCAANKKAAKHQAYDKGKVLLEGGVVTIRQTSEGVFELKQKDPPVAPAGSIQPVPAPSAGVKSYTAASKAAGPTANTTYTNPKIVFHKTSHPGADKPLVFGNSGATYSQQSGPQSSASAGELAMKLLNFVKEGAAETTTQPPNTNQGFGFKKPAPVAPAPGKRMSPDKNMLKRAIDSATAGNLRAKKKMKGPLSLEDLSQFVVIDNSGMYPNLSDISILHASANHNKVVLKFEYELCKEGYNCSTVLGVHLVSTAQGKSKEEAKTEAAKEALKHLREICYTVLVKQDVDNDAEGMTKTELIKGDKQNQVIPDTNIGNMLLRKMGWAGGGVGKDGKGIAEPVKAEMVIGREGLGLKADQGIGKHFEKHVTSMINDYIKSDDQRDLHFSSELAKEERAVIHQIGQKLGLKTQSKGKGDDRYLIVSRKRSANQLLEHIITSGGSTSKYDVVPPSNPDVDPRKREAISFGHGKQ